MIFRIEGYANSAGTSRYCEHSLAAQDAIDSQRLEFYNVCEPQSLEELIERCLVGPYNYDKKAFENRVASGDRLSRPQDYTYAGQSEGE